MADVFVSYARPDEEPAECVADALRGAGYRVWRDDELPAHRAYAEVIEERLKAAQAVVVLWSAAAAKSQWVRAEAEAALAAGTLVQARIDGSIPPMPFNQVQCADLGGWNGDTGAPGWRKLAASVEALARATEPEPQRRERRPARRPVSVCVLPFANMSGDAEQEYFSDGISEDITTDLSKVSALGVVARNTAFTFKNQSVDVCAVARKLDVSHVLEGSVRKAGGRVRINAQLIDGATGDHVWAERYDRDLDDIFAIQDEISSAIVRALRLKLLPEEKKALEKRGTSDAQAYSLYLLARQYWVTGNHGDMRREERVMRICSRALERDPRYAHAWALLAFAQSNLRYLFGESVNDGVAAAHTALAIDPSIAQAHCPMVRRLEEKRQFAEADARIEVAVRLDPESWEVNKEAGRVCMRQGRLEDAARHFRAAVAITPGDVHAWARLVTLHRALGDEAAMRQAAEMAVAHGEQVLAQDPSNGAAMSFVACGFAALGRKERADEWIDRAMLIDPDNLSMRYNLAGVLAAVGETDRALRMLDRPFAKCGAFQVSLAEADPDLATIRADPRFKKMLAQAKRRLGIVDAHPDKVCVTIAEPAPPAT